MPSLPRISIERPVFAWMLMALIITFGVLSFFKLGISQLPDVNFPVVSISLILPGAAPDIMESQVIDPIEDSIMQIDGVRSVSSNAQQSSGSISVEFELNKNIDLALEEVRNHIARIQNLLPNTLYPARLRKTNPEDQPILWLGLTTDYPKASLIDLMIYAKDTLSDQFSTVPGVGDIVLGGYVDPALRVWVNLNKMNTLDLTSDDVLIAIQNEHLEIPIGKLSNNDSEFQVRFLSEAHSPEEFGLIRINQRKYQGLNHKPTLLKEVAKIEEGTVDVRRISRMNGKPAIGLGIIKQHGSNAVKVASAVKEKLANIQKHLPKDFHLNLRSDNTRFIRQSVNQLLFTLSLSILLTSFVCYLFFGNWTSTLNVLLSIPTSMIGTFTVFYFLKFTLNTFTLLGLSLAVGIVVDDAIMILENIVRHRESGQSRKNAALYGAEEITFVAIAATFAIAAIFVPVMFMKGVIGKYFFQYGATVTVAVLLSLLEALTLTPMRCSQYLKISDTSKGLAFYIDFSIRKLSFLYEKILKVLLNHRWKAIFISIGFFFITFLIAKKIPSEMMPIQDQSMFMIRIKLPVGTGLLFTDTKMKEIENTLLEKKEISNVISAVGGFGGDAVNQGMIYITLVDKDKRKLSQKQLIDQIRLEFKKKFKGTEISIQDLSLRGFAATRGFPIEFTIQGSNWDTLTELSQKIIQKIKESGKVVDVNTDVQKGMPEIPIKADRKKLKLHGVSMNTVTSVINALMGGAILNKSTEYSKKNHRYSIEVRLLAEERSQMADLNHVMLRNNRGERIPLSALTTLEVKPSLLLISRLNRSRAITIYGNPAPNVSQEKAIQETQELAKSMLPPGYNLEMVGNSKSFHESFQSLIAALILGIIVSYMVLASQFNSFVHPMAVLMALPFSFSGALIALALCNQSINMYSLIGFILLMGIVKKNSILLVDFTNQCRKEMKNVNDALLKACPIRLRPILMTSLATIAGALPEALSLGPGSEVMIPMAVAIIGGVIASTILTLFIVPCFYSLSTKLEKHS